MIELHNLEVENKDIIINKIMIINKQILDKEVNKQTYINQIISHKKDQ